jgi:predicted NUDIX family NTP pyrophosphohydrolase
VASPVNRIQEFHEIDRALLFGLEAPSKKILKRQAKFLDRLEIASAEDE